MKKLSLLFVLLTMFGTAASAQVTYMETNHFLLNFFTSTGYASYDWRFEPLKTDLERGQLKGDVKRVITTIVDKTGRGFGEHFSDTTLYNKKGNIVKVTAPKVDEFNPRNKFVPDSWTYQYDDSGKLTSYTWMTQVESMNGKYMQKHIHDMKYDARGNLSQEIYAAFSLEPDKTWKEFAHQDEPEWTFKYDANGALTGGQYRNFSLTYQNGQLVKMKADDMDKPVTCTYDANGRMTSFKHYSVDGMDDEEWYYETTNTFTYNPEGYISKVTHEQWEMTPKWQRKKRSELTTYTITYTYGTQGNWTKAVIKSKAGKAPAQTVITITRVIE